MPPRIAIPLPHSSDHEYSRRAIPQYERAVLLAGGEPVRIALELPAAQGRGLVERCDAVLLPGSKADVDPGRFQQEKSPHTAGADLRREAVDDLLLEHAYAQRKPVLGICYGLQSLNIFRRGSLIQHIADFLPEESRSKVNHEAGRAVPIAHTVSIDPHCQLGQMLRNAESENSRAFATATSKLIVPVNSSHHQSANSIGEGLRITATCPDDGIVEALEGTTRDHFVLAVQWHPERSVDDDNCSRLIFRALVDACR